MFTTIWTIVTNKLICSGRRVMFGFRPLTARDPTNVTLTDTQIEWQLKARQFAQEELKPISFARDGIPEGLGPFDWDVCGG